MFNAVSIWVIRLKYFPLSWPKYSLYKNQNNMCERYSKYAKCQKHILNARHSILNI